MDISYQWGADLATGPTGDLALATNAQRGQQRVLRRLLTSPGDYLWQPDYGAGLARFIGQPGNAAQIRAAIRGQIFKEDAVARTPEPVIEVSFSPAGDAGAVYVQLRYVDAPSRQTQLLSFSVGT